MTRISHQPIGHVVLSTWDVREQYLHPVSSANYSHLLAQLAHSPRPQEQLLHTRLSLTRNQVDDELTVAMHQQIPCPARSPTVPDMLQ